MTRRSFLAAVAVALVPRRAWARAWKGGPHPEPRPGITAARVCADAALEDRAAAPAFAMAREIPQVIDGIRCQCGCAEREGFRSLLTCFEGDGMAQHCQVCQREVRLAHRLHREGKSLREIRAAIDEEFG